MAMLTKEMLDDRGLVSLNDALRNVPGITLGAGEFSWQGNNPTIRGFSSRDDMYLDGLRDFGSYPRDPFNLETVEVLLGPSSILFGRGSTGGAINQATKQPQRERAHDSGHQRRQRRDRAGDGGLSNGRSACSATLRRSG